MATLSKKEITDELWRRGELKWKLDKVQKELYDAFYGSNHKVLTWLLARRNGKTYTLFIIALEQCIRQKNSIVKFVAPTKIQINNILRPLFRQILEDCPEELRPEFKAKDYIYYFPNGSEIQLAGTDNKHAEKLRGGDSHIAIVDEARDCSGLNNVVTDILLPTTLITKGKIILASTPPKDAEHDFLKFIEEADVRGSLIKKTIHDNPRITPEQLAELEKEMGGRHTESFRREALCEIIKDSTINVIPEFTEALEKEIVKEWPLPPFFDCYEAMDVGFKDLTVVLLGYYDFRADKLIIQDEVVMDFGNPDNNIPVLVDQLREKEKLHWMNILTNEQKKPYLRISDIDYFVTQQILKDSHNEINFQPVAKNYEKGAALHDLRVLLANKKIIIHPRCTTLVRHLRNVKWMSANNKAKFARSKDNGHYDAVDALIYFTRSVVYGKNPYPSHYGLNLQGLHIQNPRSFQTNQVDVFRRIFNLKGKD